MKDLYVIGNGFDIHHGIPSSYKAFRRWLEDNDPELLSRMDEVLGLCTEEWWNEFETNLGEVYAIKDYTEGIAFENQPNLASEDFRSGDWDNARYEIEDKLGGLISDLKADFQLWASQLPPGNDGEVVLVNRENAFFLTFNYSMTLEKLYGISPVCRFSISTARLWIRILLLLGTAVRIMIFGMNLMTPCQTRQIQCRQRI